MKDNELVSVIVPVYNAEKYIKKCIESILNQTYKNIELILVDDGSKDKSGEICDEYAQKDKRVKVIHKENGGAASARNRGIDIIKGDFVAFCDTDDYFELDMIENILNVLLDNDLPTIEFLSQNRTYDGQLLERENDDRQLTEISADNAIKNIFLHTGRVSLSTRVTRAEYIKDIRIPEGRRVEDFYFTIVLLKKIGKTAIYNYPYYNYTTNPNSVTNSATGSIYLDSIYFYNKAIELVGMEKDKEEKEYYLFKAYYLLFISSLYKEINSNKSIYKEIVCDIREKASKIQNNKYLLKKEKLVLKLSKFSIYLPRFIYKVKCLFTGRS